MRHVDKIFTPHFCPSRSPINPCSTYQIDVSFYVTLKPPSRCQCWMAFTWISAGLLCCPPLLGYSVPLYNKEAYVCMLDWGNMAAYSATLGILVLGPSVISIVHNYGYIFVMMRRLRSGEPIHDKEYATALAENLANPSHMMSFVLVFAFWASWLPLIFVRIYQGITGYVIQNTMVNFGLVWIGVLNSFWKIVIMTAMSPQFRIALRVFCLTICCKTKGRLQAELIGLDPDDWSR
uniref:G-protein coupled receptors family 1 profile domain-containing protein n=1 Tax=Megaselia scalaris TaxID=36166 RepID=T1GQK0_MEGSC